MNEKFINTKTIKESRQISSLIKVIIIDNDKTLDDIVLCIQALLANTNYEHLAISLYTNKLQALLSEISWILDNKKIEIYYNERINCSLILASIQQSLVKYSGIVLLDTQAIVGQNWFKGIQQAAEREDVAVVVTREIRHRNDRLAWDLIPYAMNSSEIDIALSEQNNCILDPAFDEANLLVSINKLSLFCLYFKKNVLQRIDFGKFASEDLNDWKTKVYSAISNEFKMNLVYTSKSKVFHSSFFNYVK